MSLILTPTRSLLGLGITFALCLLCCTVQAVPNEGEEKRNAANDKGGFYRNCSSSFQADINKILYAFVCVSSMYNKIYLHLGNLICVVAFFPSVN